MHYPLLTMRMHMQVYDYEEVETSIFDVEFAKLLYQTPTLELVWNRTSDVKALIAWDEAGGSSMVVVAFKGTSRWVYRQLMAANGSTVSVRPGGS